MKKYCFILGTRPEIIKLSPIIRLCERRHRPYFIIHTNQHYSENMDRSFFRELGLKRAKYNLGIREHLHGKMVGTMLGKIEEVLIKEKPTTVFVQGDTNTVLAGALAAAKLQIPVGHVEAGLRSYDRSMPEETNRVITDHISTFLYCPTRKQAVIAKGEGITREKVIVTGNTVVDAVRQNLYQSAMNKKYTHYAKESYFLLTLHRPSNVDNMRVLKEILSGLYAVAKKYDLPIYFPAHPRTVSMLSKFRIKVDERYIKKMNPVGYLEMLELQKHARLIFTDSGGIQEEACILRVPCITIRDNTERPETIDVGANLLAGTHKQGIVRATSKMLKKRRTWRNPFGDGKAAERILKNSV